MTVSLPSTQTNISSHLCVRILHACTQIHIPAHVCVHAAHTHLCTHTHTHTSICSDLRHCVCMCVCVHTHTALCVCMCIHRHLAIYKHSLSSQQRLCAAVILPYESGIPSFPRRVVWRPSCSSLGSLPSCRAGTSPSACPNGTVRRPRWCSLRWHFSLDCRCSLLFVVARAGCGGAFFGVNCK